MAALLVLLFILLCPLNASAGLPLFAPPVPPDTCHLGCGFNGLGCFVADYYHTGQDYIPDGEPVEVRATADGVVAGVFTIDDPDAADHGMGNALILRHVLSSGEDVFSLYGHLAHLERDFAPGEEVLRGETVGLMGGSGFGQPTYWGWHLHFEIKTAAVLGDPKSGQHEGYTPTPAGNWGYFDPAQFIDQAQFVPERPEALSPPEPPSGPATAAAGETVRFRSGGAACTWYHRVEYRFVWGDGESSGWLEEPSATHAWRERGGFTVRVRARCADNPALLSETATAAIEITEPSPEPDPPPASSSTSNGGGCFLATAAWGANAPELHALRRLRDEWLARYRPGRAFINRYYRLSPAAARFLAASPLRRALVRGMLRPPYWAAECWLWLGGWAAWLVVALGWLAFCEAPQIVLVTSAFSFGNNPPPAPLQ